MKTKIITLSIVAVVAMTSVGLRSVIYDVRSSKKLAVGRTAQFDIRSSKKLAVGRTAQFDIRSSKKALVA
ncbi:hypothetical protein [Mucilaginibacter sp. CSA2-8R]|uniref:hypothetical protein n=1 Tax=Mucilaginibacter sp. CSA2-8R TaxID=3141542 RepID=UPI00315D1604